MIYNTFEKYNMVTNLYNMVYNKYSILIIILFPFPSLSYEISVLTRSAVLPSLGRRAL